MARLMSRLGKLRKPRALALAGAVVLGGFAVAAFIPSSATFTTGAEEGTNVGGTPVKTVSAERHLPTPEPLKGIYMSQCVVGTPSFRDTLVKLIDDTALNAVVIDIKDYTGKIAFTTENPILKDSVSDKCGAADMKEFVRTLHEKGIYVIGRITVFQDPYYTKLHPAEAVQSKAHPGTPWKDFKGLSFIDVSSRGYWGYVVELSKEAYSVFGFDELNYDYIRYPSDGPMADAVYVNPNRAEAVETFWAYLHEKVHPTGAVMSADLFGMTTTNTDDLGIGQQLERAMPHFDYIMPMVYPSHYPKGWNGLSNPNLYPYEVIKLALEGAVRRTVSETSAIRTLTGKPVMKTEFVPPAEPGAATTTREVATGLYTKKAYSAGKIRPWLQDFDYGKDYTPEDVRLQIQGTIDAGLTSWIFWDPGNRYNSLESYLSR